jgi:Flp pilus assembly protein TadB
MLPGVGFGILGGYLLSLFTIWAAVLAVGAFATTISLMVLSATGKPEMNSEIDSEEHQLPSSDGARSSSTRRWEVVLTICAWTLPVCIVLISVTDWTVPNYFAAAAVLLSAVILWKRPELRRAARRKRQS